LYELAHLGIVVKDCELSIDFYCEVLGCTIKERMINDKLKIVNLQHGALTIELLEYLAPSTTSRTAGIYDHLAFAVPDVQLAIDGLRKKGVEFESDVPRLAFNGKKIIFFTGPDGERIELVEEKTSESQEFNTSL